MLKKYMLRFWRIYNYKLTSNNDVKRFWCYSSIVKCMLDWFQLPSTIIMIMIMMIIIIHRVLWHGWNNSNITYNNNFTIIIQMVPDQQLHACKYVITDYVLFIIKIYLSELIGSSKYGCLFNSQKLGFYLHYSLKTD